MGICKNYSEAKELAQQNADLFRREYVAFIDTSGNARVDPLATFDKALPSEAEIVRPKNWSKLTPLQLDAKYQVDIKELGKTWKKGDPPCPPCPRCGGTVKPWEAHIVTGAECVDCKWSMSEGSGALV